MVWATMSTANHDQTKSCKTPARSEEEDAFDGKRIKKERNDVCVENGVTAVVVSDSVAAAAAATAADDSAMAIVEKRRESPTVPAGRIASNGFHGNSDPLQELIVTKFAMMANRSVSSKQDKIRIMIEDGIRLNRF